MRLAALPVPSKLFGVRLTVSIHVVTTQLVAFRGRRDLYVSSSDPLSASQFRRPQKPQTACAFVQRRGYAPGGY